MICVAVCTRKRPKMLRRLLESCSAIPTDSRTDLRFVIVENGSQSYGPELVSEFSGKLNIAYINEPEVGITNARNAAIEYFLNSDARWLGFLDDDEYVLEGWLAAMLNAIEQFPGCLAFAGPSDRQAVSGGSVLLSVETKRRMPTGTLHWNASTANVLLHRSVFSQSGYGIRFDPRFNKSGGSDTRLFFQLKDLGERMIWVDEAICIEPTIPDRAKLNVRTRRVLSQSQNWGKITILRFGPLIGGARNLLFSFLSLVNFVTHGIVGGFILIFSEKYGFAILSRSLKFGLKAIGLFQSNFFKSLVRYEDTDGY